MENSDTRNVGVSKYHKWLDAVYARHEDGSRKEVETGYKLLREDGKTPQEARAILEHDLGKIWRLGTILQYMPAEAKDQKMAQLRQKRTEKQEHRKNTSYEELQEALKIPVAVGVGAVEPAIKPELAKKIADIVRDKDKEIARLQAAVKNKPALGTKAPKLNTEEGKLQIELDKLRSQLAPYSVNVVCELWGKNYNFVIEVEPAKRTARLLRTKDLKN